jgi:hypothetical protein
MNMNTLKCFFNNRFVAVGAAIVLTSMASSAQADQCITPAFDANFDVSSLDYNVRAMTVNYGTPDCDFFGFYTQRPVLSLSAGGGVISIPQLNERQDINFMMGVATGVNPLAPTVDSLVLFTNTQWADAAAGQDFSMLFPGIDKSSLINALLTVNSPTTFDLFDAAVQTLVDFTTNESFGFRQGRNDIGFQLGDSFSVVAFSTATLIGAGESSITPATGAIPEPQSWAMLIAGFGLTGAMLRRRRTLATA